MHSTRGTTCSMVLRQIFYRFTGSAPQTHCARRPQLVSKNFLEEEIFAGTNFRELAFDRENCENFPLYGICIGIGTADMIANIIVYLQYRQIVV